MARDYKDTVRKLLAKAQGASTPEESAAFTAKATELMFTHQIEHADIADTDTADTLGVWNLRVTGYARPKATLITVIAQAFDCEAIIVQKHGGGSSTIAVFGWEAELETVKVLYASLEMQAESQVTRAALNNWHENGRTFKTSFLYGFANQVGKRLQAQRKKVRDEQATTGTTIALYDRARAVTRYAHQNVGGTVRTSRASASSHGAFGAGQAAGARADLGGASLGGQRKAIGR